MRAELGTTLVLTALLALVLVTARTGWELVQLGHLLRLPPAKLKTAGFWLHWTGQLVLRPAWWCQTILMLVPVFFLAWGLASLKSGRGTVLPGSLKQGDLES